MTLEQIEKKAILERLIALDFCVLATAKSLGISDRTVYNKLKVWGLPAKHNQHIRMKVFHEWSRNVIATYKELRDYQETKDARTNYSAA